MESERNREVSQAWLTAALYRSKKMPPLKKLLGGEMRPGKRQSWQEMLRACSNWTKQVERLANPESTRLAD
jgi:hypothetical protein